MHPTYPLIWHYHPQPMHTDLAIQKNYHSFSIQKIFYHGFSLQKIFYHGFSNQPVAPNHDSHQKLNPEHLLEKRSSSLLGVDHGNAKPRE